MSNDLMSDDDKLVEAAGRQAVLDKCAELGCSSSRCDCCVPHSGLVDLCKECYDAVTESEKKRVI